MKRDLIYFLVKQTVDDEQVTKPCYLKYFNQFIRNFYKIRKKKRKFELKLENS